MPRTSVSCCTVHHFELDKTDTSIGRPTAPTANRTQGGVSFYERSGGRLYLRALALSEQDLKLQYKLAPLDVTPASLADHPLTPPHLGWLLVWSGYRNKEVHGRESELLPGR